MKRFFVVLLLLISLSACRCTFFFYENTDQNGNNNSSTTLYRTYNWDFRGISWVYNTDIPQSTYDYFADKPRSNKYKEYVLNPDDDEWMNDLANLFIKEAQAKGWDESYYIPFALSFVQSIPYASDNVTTGYDEYPRYPVETIVDNEGDCEDTSILFASIVREMGFGVALLLLEEDEHMAAGILISQDFIDNWDKDYDLAYYPDSEGNKYAYCETTVEGWRVGEMPDDLIGSANVIDVF